jgi:hypothetical protein
MLRWKQRTTKTRFYIFIHETVLCLGLDEKQVTATEIMEAASEKERCPDNEPVSEHDFMQGLHKGTVGHCRISPAVFISVVTGA